MPSLQRVFPALAQAPYHASDFRGDLVAGITVGVMLIPQGLAYAMIAGLPPIYGLYASLVPVLLYPLIGTSRHMAVGPTALIALLMASGIGAFAGTVEEHITLILLLTLMVGAIQLALGLARLGFLSNFLSHPILSGFTSAAALIIGISQLKYLLGIELPRTGYVPDMIWQAFSHLQNTHLPSLLTGLISVFLLLVLKYWKKTIPGALIVVILGTLAAWFFRLNQGGIEIVGAVPGGLPDLFLPSFDAATLRTLWPPALTIAFISFIDGVAIGKVHAAKNGYELDANRELIGLGFATLVGAFFRGYPTTGSFARTAVNVESGARTGLSGIISAGIVALTLLFFTPLFYYLPNTVLAAIVIVAVLGLIDVKGAVYLWQVDRQDFYLMLLTFVTTLGLGIEEGIIVGVLASLFTFIYRSSRPHTAEMGQLPGTKTFRNLERNPDALVRSEVRIFRMDASLYFANVAYFKERLYEVSEENGAPRAIVIDLYPVNRIDSTGVDALREAIKHLREEGCEVYLASVKGPVLDKLEASGILEFIGEDKIYHEVHEAVSAAERSPPASPPSGQPLNGKPKKAMGHTPTSP